MLLLFLVMVFWSSDNMALPAVYAEIAQTFGLTVSDLSILGLVRGIFESICALPAGILAERLERPWLIAWGCCIWAGALGACAFAPNLRFAWAWVFWRCYIHCHDYISLHLMCVHVCAYIYSFTHIVCIYIRLPTEFGGLCRLPVVKKCNLSPKLHSLACFALMHASDVSRRWSRSSCLVLKVIVGLFLGLHISHYCWVAVIESSRCQMDDCFPSSQRHRPWHGAAIAF